MKVAVIGGGGREAAIAWACARHGHDVDLVPDAAAVPRDGAGRPDLVIVGPEAALAAGATDELTAAGIACFGPTRSLARLESSKSHARLVAARLSIPSPAFLATDDAEEAIAWWYDLGRAVVVKQNGLAGGKGVVVPADAHETEAAIRAFADIGPIVLEERLVGPECSLLAFCDGVRAVPMPVAQDHKRIGEGDTGPNTGGMGAYAPAPIADDPASLTATFIQPVIDDLARAGTPYVGVLYAGLILTADGPRLLEWNCRFGDPETQAIVPLLETDLASIALACTRGALDPASVRWRAGAACTVVAASPGYPAAPVAGAPISDAGSPSDQALVFHAGVARDGGGRLVTAGGRVMAVTGLGDDLAAARDAAYARLAAIDFDGMQVRRDIGWRAIGATVRTYASAGVDIDEGNAAVSLLKASVERTHTPAVLAGVGSFGGAIDVSSLQGMRRPVLVASTDGVGTKVELAARAGRPEVAGFDIVNHCIDDVLVQGARPLFFLDYIAAAALDSSLVASVVDGMAKACEAAGCVLLGGETAEMPGVYTPGAFDVAGTLVGVVEHDSMLPSAAAAVTPGDVLIGLGSSGPHTNGYSLLRRLFAWLPLDAQPEPLDRPLVDALLAPHRSYLGALGPALATGSVKALAHITGGGLPENLPRVLPDGCAGSIELGSWPVPPLFRLVRELTPQMATDELYRTLNMGIGMVVVCSPADVATVQASIPEETWVIGSVTAGARGVDLVAP